MENCLQAALDSPAHGIVIESSLDPRRGPSASILLQEGLLRPGTLLATSSAFGKIKSLEDARGKRIDCLVPSQPAVAIGFEAVPKIGERFQEVKNITEAQQFISAELSRAAKFRENRTTNFSEGQKVLNIILKADVLGSLEVLESMIGTSPPDGSRRQCHPGKSRGNKFERRKNGQKQPGNNCRLPRESKCRRQNNGRTRKNPRDEF